MKRIFLLVLIIGLLYCQSISNLVLAEEVPVPTATAAADLDGVDGSGPSSDDSGDMSGDDGNGSSGGGCTDGASVGNMLCVNGAWETL